MAAKSELTPRKRPTQRRSQQTVDAILEAGARVFAQRGFAGGTTNAIAETAGVSVGSLYEYFPNKGAILVAIAQRLLDQMIADVQRAIADGSADEPLAELLGRFVRTMLRVHESDPELHGVLFAEAPHPSELHACVLQMEETLAHTIEARLAACKEVTAPDTDTAAHFTVQTVEALTHRFVHHGIHDLGREAFVAEVVALLRAYLVRSA
jgi:AcrR family transcriptional regulator